MLPLLSASQIQVFTECERKWAFQYVEKHERTQHASAALGTEVQDTQLDPWLSTGRAFDFTRPSGEIANALVPLLPKPMTPGMQLRRWFGLPNPPKPGAVEIVPTLDELERQSVPSPRGTFGYRGELDIYATNSACVPGLEGGVPLVADIKTTSNLMYAKSETELRTDIQAQLYAMVVMFQESVDVADLVWFYVRTRKPHRVQRTYVRVTASHVAEQFQRIDEIGERVRAIKEAKPKAEDLPPNVRMCEAYGGCPFRSRCSGATSPAVQAAAVNKEALIMSTNPQTNSFLNSLRKQVTPAAAAPAPVPFPATPPPVEPRQPDPVEPFMSPAAEQLPPWATSAVDPRVTKPAINPPESTLPPAQAVNVAAPVAAPEAPKARRGRPPKGETLDAPGDSGPTDVISLVMMMKANGIRRLAFDGAQIREIEIDGRAA